MIHFGNNKNYLQPKMQVNNIQPAQNQESQEIEEVTNVTQEQVPAQNQNDGVIPFFKIPFKQLNARIIHSVVTQAREAAMAELVSTQRVERTSDVPETVRPVMISNNNEDNGITRGSSPEESTTPVGETTTKDEGTGTRTNNPDGSYDITYTQDDGSKTIEYYDQNGILYGKTSITNESSSDGTQITTTIYEQLSGDQEQIDAYSYTKRTYYDEQGTKFSEVYEYKNGDRKEYDYSDSGQLSHEYSVINGHERDVFYDSQGRVKREKGDFDGIWLDKTYMYNSDGTANIHFIVYSEKGGDRQGTIDQKLDAEGRLVYELKDFGNSTTETTVLYNPDGSSVATTVRSENGGFVERTVTVTHSDGSYTIITTDKDGNQTVEKFDKDGNPIRESLEPVDNNDSSPTDTDEPEEDLVDDAPEVDPFEGYYDLDEVDEEEPKTEIVVEELLTAGDEGFIDFDISDENDDDYWSNEDFEDENWEIETEEGADWWEDSDYENEYTFGEDELDDLDSDDSDSGNDSPENPYQEDPTDGGDWDYGYWGREEDDDSGNDVPWWS